MRHRFREVALPVAMLVDVFPVAISSSASYHAGRSRSSFYRAATPAIARAGNNGSRRLRRAAGNGLAVPAKSRGAYKERSRAPFMAKPKREVEPLTGTNLPAERVAESFEDRIRADREQLPFLAVTSAAAMQFDGRTNWTRENMESAS
jgi:hypothetical protein